MGHTHKQMIHGMDHLPPSIAPLLYPPHPRLRSRRGSAPTPLMTSDDLPSNISMGKFSNLYSNDQEQN